MHRDDHLRRVARGRSPTAAATRSASSRVKVGARACSRAADSARVNLSSPTGVAVPRQCGLREVISTRPGLAGIRVPGRGGPRRCRTRSATGRGGAAGPAAGPARPGSGRWDRPDPTRGPARPAGGGPGRVPPRGSTRRCRTGAGGGGRTDEVLELGRGHRGEVGELLRRESSRWSPRPRASTSPGSSPVRTREASSPKVTSRTQCRPFFDHPVSTIRG